MTVVFTADAHVGSLTNRPAGTITGGDLMRLENVRTALRQVVLHAWIVDVVLAGLPAVAAAQATTGTIRGVVRDPQAGIRAPATAAKRQHGSPSGSPDASHAATSDQPFRDWENPSRSVGGITD